MHADLDRYKKVEAAIEDMAASGIKYTFDEFCRDKHLYGEHDRKRLNDVFIACPFHKETTPSLAIDEAHRRWKCFGCAKGGKYLDFITYYDTDVLGISSSKFKKANELLKGDRELCARVGFDSIYVRESVSAGELKDVPFNRFSIRKTSVMSYLELATKMQERHCDLQVIRYALVLMQNGITPEIIEKQISAYNSKQVKTKKYSLEELNEEQ